MKVGEKYIIEISDVITTNNGNLAKIKGFNALVFDEFGLDKLECLSTCYIDRGKAEAEKSDACAEAQLSGRAMGYEQGFKDGVKHQASLMSPKAEPHEPQEGDVYRDSLGQAFMIFNVLKTKCKKMYDDGSVGEIEIEDLKTYEHVGNIKADLEALQRVVGSYE